MNIYLDFDEVLVYTIESCIKTYEYKTGVKANIENLYQWNMKDLFPEYSNEDYKAQFECNIFWDNLKLKDGARNFIERYRDRIVIVTNGTLENLHKKAKFIHDNFGEIKTIMLNCEKSFIDMSDGVFIDDNQDNLFISNAKRKICFSSYGFNKEWNEDWEGLASHDFKDLGIIIENLDRRL